MRNGYDYPYTEWQKVFTEDLKPFNGYSDTTSDHSAWGYPIRF